MKSMLNLSERFKGVKSYLKRCCMDGIWSAVEGIDQVLKHNPVLHLSMLNSHYHDCMSKFPWKGCCTFRAISLKSCVLCFALSVALIWLQGYLWKMLTHMYTCVLSNIDQKLLRNDVNCHSFVQSNFSVIYSLPYLQINIYTNS